MLTVEKETKRTPLPGAADLSSMSRTSVFLVGHEQGVQVTCVRFIISVYIVG
jgi:hypothetical protein